MAEGNLILSDGTAITPEDIRLIAAEAKKILASESKEIMQYEEVASLSGISSFPAIMQQGAVLKLVRVAMNLLKGVDGKNIELTSTSDAIQWRVEGDTSWKNLVMLSSLKGDKGSAGDPVVLRKSATGIDWKYSKDPDSEWQNIVSIEDIKLRYSDLSAADKSELTKIPVLNKVQAERGTDPSGSFKWEGLDDKGNPQYILNLTLPKGDSGLPPVLKMGEVETKLPDTDVEVSIIENGYTEDGRPIYNLNFKIPAGKPGQDGNGAGNVYVTTDNIKSGKNYVFQAGADNSANGKFVEVTESENGVGRSNPNYPGAEYFNDYENNKAEGIYAHAEGKETIATGPRAHAEGYKTSVYAADAHAEGRETWAIGSQAHVEGLYTIGLGSSSHVEGSTEADWGVGEESPIILNDVEKIRDFLGNFTTKVYPYGEDGSYYFQLDAEKLGTYIFHGALGVSTHAEGINNVVCDKAGHVEGYDNIAGDMIPGHGQDSKIYAPRVEGIGNKVASLLYAVHVGGANCIVHSGNYSFAHGYNLSISNDYETAFGKFNLSEINGKKIVFSVGIGTSDTNRKNALSVFEDGSVEITGLQASISKEQIEEIVSNSLITLSAKIDSLDDRINTVETTLDEITALLSSIYTGTKVHVVGDRLVFTSLIDANVTDGTLVITDNETRVEEDTLIFEFTN